MTQHSKLRILLLTAVLTLMSATVCRAAAGITDSGAFFSEGAETQAGKIIADLHKDLKKDVVLETYLEIPADMRAGAEPQSKESMNRLFDVWAHSFRTRTRD